MNTRFLQAEELKICRLYQTPLANGDLPTALEIAQIAGCSDGTVRNILVRHGVPVRQNKGRQISKMFDKATELSICEYYWTRLPTGYYPSYKETAEHFGCSTPLIKIILNRHGAPHRTQAETRERRPCKPINQPVTPAPLCACGCGQPTQWMSKDRYWTKYAKGHYRGTQRKVVQSPDHAPWAQAPMKHGWSRLSIQIKERDHWTCQLCGRRFVQGSGYLQVHHIDQDRANNHPLNLVALCAKCHAPAHNNEPVRATLKQIAARSTP